MEREIARDFGPKFSKNFRGRRGENFRSKAGEIAPKSMPHACTQLADDPERSLTTVASVGMVWNVRLRAIRIGFRTEIFEKFSRPRKFALEITRDRAVIRVAAWCLACSGPSEVRNIYADCRHAAAREIACDSRPKFSKILRGRENLRSK